MRSVISGRPPIWRAVLEGLLRDHLRVDERVLASTVFPDSGDVAPTAGLVG